MFKRSWAPLGMVVLTWKPSLTRQLCLLIRQLHFSTRPQLILLGMTTFSKWKQYINSTTAQRYLVRWLTALHQSWLKFNGGHQTWQSTFHLHTKEYQCNTWDKHTVSKTHSCHWKLLRHQNCTTTFSICSLIRPPWALIQSLFCLTRYSVSPTTIQLQSSSSMSLTAETSLITPTNSKWRMHSSYLINWDTWCKTTFFRVQRLLKLPKNGYRMASKQIS